jgi:hypothetical protein
MQTLRTKTVFFKKLSKKEEFVQGEDFCLIFVSNMNFEILFAQNEKEYYHWKSFLKRVTI